MGRTYPYSGIPDPLSNDKQIEVAKGKNQPYEVQVSTTGAEGVLRILTVTPDGKDY